jgi:hypothetical protein
MEVASPLTSLRPSPGGAGGGLLLLSSNKKRACSPSSQCGIKDIDHNNHNNNNDHHMGTVTVSHHPHVATSKRRRFHAPSDIDALSADFSSHNLFFNTTGSNHNNKMNTSITALSQPKSLFATNGGKVIYRNCIPLSNIIL